VRRTRTGTVAAERRRERTGYVVLLFDHANQAPQAENLEVLSFPAASLPAFPAFPVLWIVQRVSEMGK